MLSQEAYKWLAVFIATSMFHMALVVFFNDRRNPINRLFALYLLIAAYWTGMNVLTAYLRIVPPYLYPLSIPVNAYSTAVFYLFSRALVTDDFRLKKHEWVYLAFGLYFTGYTVYLFLDPVSFEALQRETRASPASFKRPYVGDASYLLYILYLVVPGIGAIIQLLRGLRLSSDRHQRRRVAIVLIAVAGGIVLIVTSTMILPRLGILEYSVVAPLTVLVAIVAVTVSILGNRAWRIESLLQIIEETRSRLKERNDVIEKELDLARALHARLLPAREPQGRGLYLDAVYRPMDKVGGDYYDFLETRDRTIVFIGDASGHGIPGAFLSSIAHMALHSFSSSQASPAELLRSLNEKILHYTTHGMFLTALCCDFDHRTRRVRIANAGHTPPILCHAGNIEEVEAKGRLIGVFPDINVSNTSIELALGDRLFLYTDGITECLNESRQMFGDDRLQQALIASLSLESAEVLAAIEKRMRDFAGNSRLADDLTMVLMEAG